MENKVTFDKDRVCRCMFCMKSFKLSEMEFCVRTGEDSGYEEKSRYDHKFAEQINKYKDGALNEVPYRAWIEWDEEGILSLDEEGLPVKVRGVLRNEKKSTSFGDSFHFSLSSGEQEEKQENTEDTVIIRESSVRVCPHCHMTVPTGIMHEKKIRIGLLGGTRSGKTTYMVVATKYIRERFSDMEGGVSLGTVSFVPECEKYVEAMYSEKDKIQSTRADSADLESDDTPVIPVIMRIKPGDSGYKPFLLILQDIPGEYMKPEHKDTLASSAIKDSTDLIMLVDINHWVQTRQKDDKNRYGEYCALKANRLFENMENLGSMLNKEEMKSVQVTLTKLDLWIEKEPRLKATVFSRPCDGAHKNSISEKRLAQVNGQLRTVIDRLFKDSLLDEMTQRLGMETVPTVKKVYTAVASRTVPEHDETFKSGVDVNYEYSLNVLEPLLNVFAAHKVLPVTAETVRKK